MPYIRVQPQNLRRASETIRNIERDIEQIEEEFRSISRRLDWDVTRELDIDWMLRCIDNELRGEEHALNGMTIFLEHAASQYEELDRPTIAMALHSITLHPKLPFIVGVHPTPMEQIHSELLIRMKNLLDGIGKLEDNDTLGFSADILNYCKNFLDFFTGDIKEEIGLAKWCKLVDSSGTLWKGLYELIHDGFKNEQLKELFETKFGSIAAGVGIGGSFAGLIGSIFQASQTHDWNDYAEIGGSGIDVGKEIYKLCCPSASKYAVHTYTSILKSGVAFSGQVAESVEKYNSDGKWTMGDTGATGVEASIEGLNTLVSEFTCGIVSLETLNTSPEEVSDNLLSGAGDWGTQAGNYIRENPDLKNEFDNSGGFNKARMLLWAIGKTGIMRLKS